MTMTIEPKNEGMPWFPQILLASAAGYGIAKAANCTEVGTVVTVASTTLMGIALADDKNNAYPYSLWGAGSSW